MLFLSSVSVCSVLEIAAVSRPQASVDGPIFLKSLFGTIVNIRGCVPCAKSKKECRKRRTSRRIRNEREAQQEQARPTHKPARRQRLPPSGVGGPAVKNCSLARRLQTNGRLLSWLRRVRRVLRCGRWRSIDVWK